MKFNPLIPDFQRLSGSVPCTTGLLARVVVGTLLLGTVLQSPSILRPVPAGAVLLVPPSEPDLPEAERQSVDDGLEETLATIITEPTTIDPAVLAGLPAAAELLGTAGVVVQSLREELQDAEQEQLWAEGETVIRTGTVAAAESANRRAVVALDEAEANREDAERDLTVLGIDAFVNQSDQADIGALLTAANDESGSATSDAIRAHELYRSAGTALGTELVDRQRRESEQEQILTDSIDRLDRETGLLASAREIQEVAAGDIERLTPQLAAAERDFERQLLLRTVPGTDDLTVVAVNAYFSAARAAASQWPACEITWNQLAGVGRVESFHGQFGRSSVDRRGDTSPPILGPQLNGDPWLAIADSDLGILDGDLEWDRAVGPMQFIPTSWEQFAADGNNDGRRDPHNLYDAALAAADHLCGAGLDTEAGFRSALLRYNRSTTYGSDVIRFSDFYNRIISIDPVPEGDTDQPIG